MASAKTPPVSARSLAPKTTNAISSGPDLPSLLALLAQQNSKFNMHVTGAMSTITSMRTVQSALVDEGKTNGGFELCDEHAEELSQEIADINFEIDETAGLIGNMLDSMKSVVSGLREVEYMFDPETYFRSDGSDLEFDSESAKGNERKEMGLKHGTGDFRDEVKALCKDAAEKGAEVDVLTAEDGVKQKLDVEMRG